MQTATQAASGTTASAVSTFPVYPPLDRETRAAVDTETAAYHLSREPQTLRVWACKSIGPLQPIRVCGRLAWPVADLKKLLGVAA